MSLSCSYNDYEAEPGMKCWYYPEDYSKLETLRRKRCCSCGELIDKRSIVAKFVRYKVPENDIEINIYGEDGEVPLADHYMCERCADLYFSLEELGFYIQLGNDMRDLVKEYGEMHE